MKRLPLLTGLVVLIVLLIGLLAVRYNKPRPLTYSGKPLEYWFAQLPVTPVPPPGIDLGNVQGFVKNMGQTYGGNGPSGGDSITAIGSFGTNAIPFLLRKLQGIDSAIEQTVTRAATNAGVSYLPFRKAELERLQAVTGLIHTTSLPSDAQQTLVALRASTNRDIASAATYILTRRATLDAAPSPVMPATNPGPGNIIK
jgi:hypothetical protein